MIRMEHVPSRSMPPMDATVSYVSFTSRQEDMAVAENKLLKLLVYNTPLTHLNIRTVRKLIPSFFFRD